AQGQLDGRGLLSDMITRKITVVVFALCALGSQAQAECICVCINEQLQPHCTPADDIANAQSCTGVCGPVTPPAPTVAPVRNHSTHPVPPHANTCITPQPPTGSPRRRSVPPVCPRQLARITS